MAPSDDIFMGFPKVIHAVDHFGFPSHEIFNVEEKLWINLGSPTFSVKIWMQMTFSVYIVCILVTITFAFLGCLGIC